MVKVSKICSALLAFGLVVPSSATYNRTSQSVTYLPLFEQWIEEDPYMKMNLTTTFDLINSDYLSLYDDAGDLTKRTSIEVRAQQATVLSVGATVIVAAGSISSIVKDIASLIKSKGDDKSLYLDLVMVLIMTMGILWVGPTKLQLPKLSAELQLRRRR